MCAKCQANKARAAAQASRTVATPCKYSLQELQDALEVTTDILERAWLQSAINVSSTIHCNKYNNKIDEFI